MDEHRTDPERLLQKIKQESGAQGRGHLKIFFGYAAGVGKTYAMLKAAHAAKRRGVDVVVGYVEPHMRPQTTVLLNGLEQLPALEAEHKGIKLREFDLDQAIKRAPQLILVDELAHTNADGCRHNKRYQDVQELLTAGIDVYTTVNVQHIESLNDMVASITGVSVRERVPDHLFDDASQVELVDIEPEELIERLNDGKIYRNEQAKRALGSFFSVENLTALREIALRRCADRVNKISEKVRPTGGSDYFTDEQILVCLSSSPTNAKIIRTAARMADAFKGGFTALFVETPTFAAMDGEDKERLRANIRLAQQLGAAIETVYGEDIALQIAEFARLSGVSKIVMGRSSASRRYFFGKPSLTERLTAAAPNLDIYIIPDKEEKRYRPQRPRKRRIQFSVFDLLKSLLVLALCTGIGFLFDWLGFSEANIITIYILGVLTTAVITTGRVYSLALSVVSVLVFNFFFTDPRLTFQAYDSGYPVTFFVMFIAAFITSSLATKIKLHAKQSAQTAFRTKILFDTNQQLQKGQGKSEIISMTANQLVKLLKRDIIFYPEENGRLGTPGVFLANEASAAECYTAPNEQAVAAWVFKNNKRAGATTGTLGSAKCLYLAVRVSSAVYGVIGIGIGDQPLVSFENSIVLSILGECALALENDKAVREREQSAVLAKNEQLRANLLRSISHDLRTPLTSISGNAGILLSSGESIPPDKKQKLYTDIYEDSLWLINLVENLLSVTKIEDGSMHLNKTAELIDEIITEALRHISRESSAHKIIFRPPDDMLLVKADARLIMQVVINIVNNAIKYTQEGSEIRIRVKKVKNMVMVELADNGEGIPDDAKQRIFDMFYTANPTGIADNRRSLGLGLALCRSIVTAHGGEISVSDNRPRGTVFRFTLPSEEVTLHE